MKYKVKLYDQKGNWGRVISREELEYIASSVQTEIDDFTVEIVLKKQFINFEISTSDDPTSLEVYAYIGSSINPITQSVRTSEIVEYINAICRQYETELQ